MDGCQIIVKLTTNESTYNQSLACSQIYKNAQGGQKLKCNVLLMSNSALQELLNRKSHNKQTLIDRRYCQCPDQSDYKLKDS